MPDVFWVRASSSREKGAEGFFVPVFRDAGAVVVDMDFRRVRPVHQSDPHRIPEFHGIGDEVGQRPA